MAQFSTQQYIEIAGIKEGIVILKNGGYRLILSVSTTNFALKSEQEQNSIVFQYQSFLNSLHFPIEIVMRSKQLDLSPYLAKIEGLISKQDNELLQIQTSDYVDFVAKLINVANIMKKTFYVVIPYQPITVQNANFLSKLFTRQSSVVSELRISEDEFKKNTDQLRQYGQIVAAGLGGIGLHCIQLTTEEIIELFYQIYNPEIAGKERISDTKNLTSEVIMSTTEKKENEETANPQKEQPAIDNSTEVTEVQKQQSAQKHQEMMKAGERQVGMTRAEDTGPRTRDSENGSTALKSTAPTPAPQTQPPAEVHATNQPATASAPPSGTTPAPQNPAQPQQNLAYHLQNPTGDKTEK